MATTASTNGLSPTASAPTKSITRRRSSHAARRVFPHKKRNSGGRDGKEQRPVGSFGLVAVEQIEERHQPLRHSQVAEPASGSSREQHHADCERQVHEDAGDPALPRSSGVDGKRADKTPQHQGQERLWLERTKQCCQRTAEAGSRRRYQPEHESGADREEQSSQQREPAVTPAARQQHQAAATEDQDVDDVRPPDPGERGRSAQDRQRELRDSDGEHDGDTGLHRTAPPSRAAWRVGAAGRPDACNDFELANQVGVAGLCSHPLDIAPVHGLTGRDGISDRIEELAPTHSRRISSPRRSSARRTASRAAGPEGLFSTSASCS